MNDQLSETVIGAAYRVHNQLGFGFLESVYEKSLSIELNKAAVNHQAQASVAVHYDDQVVGEFLCDLLIEKRLVVELKSVRQLAVAHEVQLVKYLNAMRIDVGLLINFGPEKVDVKRKYRKTNTEKGGG